MEPMFTIWFGSEILIFMSSFSIFARRSVCLFLILVICPVLPIIGDKFSVELV